MLHRIPTGKVEAVVDLADKFPVNKVVGLEDLHAEEMEIGSHHVVGVAHPYGVRVGIIRRKDRVQVPAVAGVSPRISVGRMPA